MKHLSKNVWLLLLTYLSLWVVLFYIFNNLLLLNTQGLGDLISFSKKNGWLYALNSPGFWESPVGVILRLSLEIFITSIILYFTFGLFKVNAGFSVCLTIVVLSHSIFLIQYVCEFFFFKYHPELTTGNQPNDFSLFSVQYFLSKSGITNSPYLFYASQVLNVFEVAYWFILAFFVSKFTRRRYKEGLPIVFSGYVPSLFLWLLLISFFFFVKV